jgi:hypothetical protein
MEHHHFSTNDSGSQATLQIALICVQRSNLPILEGRRPHAAFIDHPDSPLRRGWIYIRKWKVGNRRRGRHQPGDRPLYRFDLLSVRRSAVRKILKITAGVPRFTSTDVASSAGASTIDEYSTRPFLFLFVRVACTAMLIHRFWFLWYLCLS